MCLIPKRSVASSIFTNSSRHPPRNLRMTAPERVDFTRNMNSVRRERERGEKSPSPRLALVENRIKNSSMCANCTRRRWENYMAREIDARATWWFVWAEIGPLDARVIASAEPLSHRNSKPKIHAASVCDLGGVTEAFDSRLPVSDRFFRCRNVRTPGTHTNIATGGDSNDNSWKLYVWFKKGN